MPRIRFKDARYPDDMPKAEGVEQRLLNRLQALRECADPDGPADHGDKRFARHPRLTLTEKIRIRGRVQAYSERARPRRALPT